MPRTNLTSPDIVPGLVQQIPKPDAAIELWLCSLDRDQHEIATMESVLAPEERARAARFGTLLLRSRWIAGRATLRQLLGRAVGLDAASVQLRRGARGRPYIDYASALDFNISHTDGIALIGIGRFADNSRIGVDIERADRAVNVDRLATKFLTARERTELEPLAYPSRQQRFLRLWTCKEAMSKATGDALSAPFGKIDIDLHEQASMTLARVAGGPPPYATDWQLIIAAVPQHLLATVAVWRRQSTPGASIPARQGSA